MTVLTKIFVVLTAVFSIALSALFVASAVQWDNYKGKYQSMQQERDAALADRQHTATTAQVALAQKQAAVQDAQRALADAQARIQSLSDDLARAKRELSENQNRALALESGRAKLEEILRVNTAELSALQKQNDELLGQNMDLQTRNAQLNTRTLELTTNVSILTDEIRNMQEKLYACERLVSNLRSGTSQPEAAAANAPETPAPNVSVGGPTVAGDITGEVSNVNGAYATINVGSASGVVRGMRFMVHRNGTYLGDLVVDRVRPQESGGKLTTLVQGEVQSGDQVSRLE